MSNTDSGWRKRQIALDKKAENARELGLDYEPSKTVMDMAREAGFVTLSINEDKWGPYLERFAALVRADERKKFLGVLRQLHDSYSLASDTSKFKEKT